MPLKNAFPWIAAVSLLLLSACRTDFLVDIYSSDLFMDESVSTPAEMKFQITSCDSDDRSEYERKTLALFTAQSNAKMIGCEEIGMTSLLVVAFDAEIVSPDIPSYADVTLTRRRFDDERVDGDIYEVVGLIPVINPDFLRRVDALLSENYTSMSYEDLNVGLVLNNDERNTVFAQASDVWVDGKPYQNYDFKPLKRRQRIGLKYSFLFSDLLLRGNRPIAIKVYREKQVDT